MVVFIACGIGLFFGSIVGSAVIAAARMARLRASAYELVMRERARIVQGMRLEAEASERAQDPCGAAALYDVADDILHTEPCNSFQPTNRS